MAALMAMMMWLGASSLATAQTYNCLPSCDPTDARFLAIANGALFVTLSEPVLDLEISVPAGTTNFTVGVFDGDARGVDGSLVAHWDLGTAGAIFTYTLYADPYGDRTGTTVVSMGGLPTQLSTLMPDNAWADFAVTTSDDAKAPSGNYFYYLRIQLTSLGIPLTNAFKVRTNNANVGGSTLFPTPEPFSYIASIASTQDAQIVYPNYPSSLVPTRYDGRFSFFFDMPVTPPEMTVWDGDFDRGKFNGTDLDTNDPDTPDAPFEPEWATPDTNPEGVAVGAATPAGSPVPVTTGNPPDDRNPGTTIANQALLKSPSVRYDLIFPNGSSFPNENPSGNQEWEQFRITRDPLDLTQMDYSTTTIPHGTYELRVQGVDLQNLNALLLPGRVLCVNDLGIPCVPLRPFLIGDTVFADDNGDGVQDPGEAGIEGVLVELIDEAGQIIATTLTDADGIYHFPVEAGSYQVHIALSNYSNEGTGVLIGYTFTIPETCTAEVGNENVEDCDFGYQGRASIGNRVWYDKNGDGVQDPGEAGMNFAQVELLDADFNSVAVTTTTGDGDYEFVDIPPGTYTVVVSPFAIPNGANPTYDLDGVVDTPYEATLTVAAGDHRMDVDFGFRGDVTIGDRVWNDVDNDGFQDPGEAGINGVTVRLYDVFLNAVVATTVTSGDGNYLFTDQFESTYRVQIVTSTLPANYTQTYDLDGLSSPNEAEIAVLATETHDEVDFGYRDANAATASVGDRVWYDTDGDGAQDPGETGLNGVTVELLDGGGNVVATTATAGDGIYTFSSLVAGTYTVRVVAASLPAGVAPTFDADGIATPHVAGVTLATGQSVTTVDFGYRGTASVGDRVWTDTNGDGVQDGGEAGINGVTVELLDNIGTVVGTTTTAGDGGYTFSFLKDGNYTVRVVPGSLPNGLAQTYDLDGLATPHAASFALAPGQNRTDVDFGYRGTGSVGDRLWLDSDGDGVQDPGEAGINGATVQLFDGGGNLIASTATAGDGVYGFTSLVGGTYTVKVVPSSLPAGVAATYDLDGVGSLHEATFTLAAGGSRDDVDFGYRGTASVGDRVWNDTDGDGVQDGGEAGINGVTVELLDSLNAVIATTTTSGDGGYTFANLLGGAYSVRVVAATLPAGLAPTYDLDGIGTANVASFTLDAGASRTDVDFGYRGTASVGDRVWNDTDGDGVQDGGEAGINGVTVELLDAGNNVVASTTTAGDGNYTFSNLDAGNYSVRVVTSSLPAGLAETYDLDGVGTANVASFTLTAGANKTDVDFGYRGTASVGDRVWNDADGDGVQDGGEAGINGLTVELRDAGNNVIATTTTSGDGNYTFSNLNPGTYSVRVTPAAGTAPTYDLDGVGTANVASFTLTAGQNRTDVDFGYRGTASAGDRVWLDTNGNGAQDSGEAGINGLTVELLDAGNNVIATTTTSGDGNYTFANLDAGTYSVRVTPNADLAPTYDLDGVGTANVAGFTLTAGAHRTDVDFGYRGTASVGDRIWNDANGDGIQGGGEAGYNGVTVQLLDAADNVLATTVTSGDGNYTFGNLMGGNYSVRVVNATLPAGVAPTYDLDGTATAHKASFSLAAGASRTDVDFGYRATASLGDRIWSDLDGDGVQDPGEAGINGVTVDLLDAADNVTASTVTSGDGNYTFSGLAPGNYTVRVVSSTVPDGFTQTYDLDGTATAHTAAVTLGTTDRTDVDFGYRPNGNCVVKADLEPLGAGNGGHDFYLPGIALDFIFVPAPGGFVVNNDGTASLTGTLRSQANPANAFTVSVQFTGFTTTAPAGSPKKEFAASSYIENGGPIDPAGWWYYTAFTGTLTGTGNYAGAVINFTNTGPAFQVGYGANNKNSHYGFSGWFNWTVVQQPSSGDSLTATGQGDINSDLIECPPANDSVGDRLWIDLDGDGVQDAGEAGINGATVQLLDTFGNVIATTTTSGDGEYSFTGLLAGNYSVRVVSASLPAGLTPTYDLDGVGTANVASFTLTGGQARTDVDFGYRGTASAGDRLWLDTDGDGLQDAGEAGINGATVQLLDGGGNVIATDTTAGDGNYTFTNLNAGNYSVRVVSASLPAGLAPTYDLDGVGTANLADFTLTGGQARTDVDFGYRGTSSVGDRLWLDEDGDGVQDAGEAGINGATVELLNGGGTVIATATTAGDGNYTFTNLNAGSYSVRVVSASLPAGVAPTYDLDGVGTANVASFTLASGTNRTDVDFGYRGTASVGDRVWLDADGDGVQDAGEAGINGVTVQLLDGGGTVIASTTTAGDGNYTFGNLGGGSYSVRVVTPAGTSPTYDLDGVGTANVAAFTLAGGQAKTDVDFGYRGTASVGDRVWIDTDGDGVQDAGEAGINGVTVQLLNGGGTVIATTTTAGDGNYTFGNLTAGNYSVRVVSSSLPAGLTPTYDLDGVGTANVAAFSLTASRTDVDFGYRGSLSVGDRLWLDTDGDGVQDAGETGLNGVTVQLLNSGGTVIATATTSGNGNYTFANLQNGNYSVRVVSSSLPAGLVPTFDLDGTGTAHVAAFSLTASRTDVDFGYRGNASVGDRLWTDTDGDGVQDAGETGINGATVQLLDAGGTVIATATTAGNGNYTFGNLAAGNYSVRVVSSSLPAGVSPTFDLDGVGTANVAAFALAAGQARTDVDFGYRSGSVGDRLWFDADGDGVQDAGETGLNGVTVQLLNSGGTVIATAVTSGNGNYTFGNLGGGNYSVRVVSSTLPAGLIPSYDLDGVATANIAAFTLTGGQSRTDVDFGYRFFACVIRAGYDPDYIGATGGHAFWFPGISTDLVFTPTPGSLAFNPDGTFRMTGSLKSIADPSKGFTVDVSFTGYTTTPPSGSPKKEFAASAYTENGGPVSTAGWTYYTAFSGTLTGTGSWAGAKINIVRAGPAFQVGAGANGKNLNFGGSGWFTWTVTQQPTSGGSLQTTGQGDINVDLIDCSTAGSVGDRVWTDTNGNGVQDASETGINGVTVQLLDSEGAVMASTVTAGNGNYTFSGLPAGSYTVKVVSSTLPAGQTATYDLDGTGTAHTAVFTLAAAQNRTDLDFGYRATYSVGDRVWKDSDGDGVQDSGETGISNITVQLLSGSTVVATDVTDSNGNYGFSGLGSGTYTVKVVSGGLPTGYVQTYDLDGLSSAHQATFSLTANRTDVDFGYKPTSTCTAAGTFKDTFTNASFSNNEGSLSWSAAWVESDSAGSGVNSGNVTVGNPVSGYLILNDSPDTGTQPSAARQMNLTGFASATLTFDFHIRGVETDDAAVIEVSKDGGATYTVLETFTGYTGTYISSRSFDISSYIASNTRIRFRISANYGGDDDYFKVDVVQVSASCTPPAPQTYSIGDQVWKDLDRDGLQDSGEPGLSGVTVQLLNSGGTVIATTTTDSNGNYSFTNRAAGSYTVKITGGVPSGLTPSYDLDSVASANQASFTLSANRTDVDFGYKPPFANPGTGTIGYWKNHPNDWPVQSITLGNQTYTKTQAINLLGTASSGDKSIDLAKQLIAAKLNVLLDNDSTCIASVITVADNWLRQYPVGSGVSGSSSAWQTGSPLHTTMDDYNNGNLCAPHRD